MAVQGKGRIPGLPAALRGAAPLGTGCPGPGATALPAPSRHGTPQEQGRPLRAREPSPSTGPLECFLRLVGGQVLSDRPQSERIVSPGETLDLELTVPHLPAFPPRVFDVVAFQTTGEACSCHRLRLSGASASPRGRVRILDLPDEGAAQKVGPWQIYVISAGEMLGRASFEVRLDPAWLRRNTRVTGLELRARRRSLAILSPQTRTVSVRARVRLPEGAREIEPAITIELLRPDGGCAGRAQRRVRSEGDLDLALGSLRLARRNEEVPPGRWEARVLIDEVVVASRAIERPPSTLLTREGEIAPAGRELIIAGVPILQD